MFRAIVAAVILVLSFVAPVAAGPLEDAIGAHNRHDYATAQRLYRPLAEQGNAIAQTNLGVLYANGLGVPKDFAEAANGIGRLPTKAAPPPKTISGYCTAMVRACRRATLRR